MEEKKTPMPPLSSLFLPVSFWSDVVVNLDKRAEMVIANGYGDIAVTIRIHQGKITGIIFNENVSLRDTILKARSFAGSPKGNG